MKTTRLLALAILAGCGKSSPPPPAPPAPAPIVVTPPKAEPPAPAPAPGTFSLTGTVKVEGKIPRIGKVPLADPKCAAMHADPPLRDELVVDADKNVRYAVVHVTAGAPPGAYPAPAEPVLLDQKGCMYDPHVFGMMRGQPVLIRNSDPFLHNVHALPFNNEEFNISQQPGAEDTRGFRNREVPVKVKCDIHPWMGAWAVVFDHPFFSVTDAKGRFEIRGLPPGPYTVEVWHEKYVSVKKQVALQGAATADFALVELKE